MQENYQESVFNQGIHFCPQLFCIYFLVHITPICLSRANSDWGKAICQSLNNSIIESPTATAGLKHLGAWELQGTHIENKKDLITASCAV